MFQQKKNLPNTIFYLLEQKNSVIYIYHYYKQREREREREREIERERERERERNACSKTSM